MLENEVNRIIVGDLNNTFKIIMQLNNKNQTEEDIKLGELLTKSMEKNNAND